MRHFILAVCATLAMATFAQAEEQVFATEDNWQAKITMNERFPDVACLMVFDNDEIEFGLVYKDSMYMLYSLDEKWRFEKTEDFANIVDFKVSTVNDTIPIAVIVKENMVYMPLDTVVAPTDDVRKDRQKTLLGEILFGSGQLNVEFPGYERWTFDTRREILKQVRTEFMGCTSRYDAYRENNTN
jgi:hypothetical protein